MKKAIITLIISLSAIILFAQEPQSNYPTKEINGKQYYEYTIVAGDGLFSIARRFEVTQTELHEINPNLSTEIKAGDIILIPIKAKASTTKIDKATRTHTVEAKQTLYGISQIYKITLDTLLILNPKATNGITVGDILIIPKDAQERKIENKVEEITPKTTSTDTIPDTHLVQKKETLFAISKRYNISIHDIITYNPGIEQGLKAGSIIYLKPRTNEKATPNATDSIKSKEQIKEEKPIVKETIKDTTAKKEEKEIFPINILSQHDTIKIAYLLPFMVGVEDPNNSAEKFIEFYRGSLIALEEAKKYAISAKIYTFDTYKTTDKIDSILALPIMQEMHYIIGPAYSNQIAAVTTFAKKHNITTIVPFSRNIDSENAYKNLVQFNPPQPILFDKILVDLFAKKHRKYLLCHYDNCTNKGATFCTELSKLLKANNIQYQEITIDNNNVAAINSMIGTDSTLLVLGSSAAKDVSPMLYHLNTIENSAVQVWGFEEWKSLTTKYHNTLYYSLFNANPTSEYIQQYLTYFGTYNNNNTWKYDLLGYDLTLLTLLNITHTATGEIEFNTQQNHIYLQSQPTFEEIDNHYINTDYHIYHWNGKTLQLINPEDF